MMIVPCLWIAWKAVEQMLYGLPPSPLPMGAVGLLALGVNLYCAFLLAPHRKGDSAHQGVWLSTRNDAIGNIAVVLAAVATFATESTWPDAIVGLGIAAINIQAAILIAILAMREWRSGGAEPA
jgi:Co/Zn/Cd efflux system component